MAYRKDARSPGAAPTRQRPAKAPGFAAGGGPVSHISSGGSSSSSSSYEPDTTFVQQSVDGVLETWLGTPSGRTVELQRSFAADEQWTKVGAGSGVMQYSVAPFGSLVDVPLEEGDWDEVERSTSTVRIYGTDANTGGEDQSVYVDVERIDTITFENVETGQRRTLNLNW